jgi:hypothetical protein
MSFSEEHLPERGSEQRITIINQEPQRAKAITQVHDEIAGLLHRPRTGRLRDHSAQVHSSGAVLNEHQHVQPFEQHCLHDRSHRR